jgi:hypothetical protein
MHHCTVAQPKKHNKGRMNDNKAHPSLSFILPSCYTTNQTSSLRGLSLQVVQEERLLPLQERLQSPQPIRQKCNECNECNDKNNFFPKNAYGPFNFLLHMTASLSTAPCTLSKITFLPTSLLASMGRCIVGVAFLALFSKFAQKFVAVSFNVSPFLKSPEGFLAPFSKFSQNCRYHLQCFYSGRR